MARKKPSLQPLFDAADDPRAFSRELLRLSYEPEIEVSREVMWLIFGILMGMLSKHLPEE